MKKWLISFYSNGKYHNKWIDFYGEDIDVMSLHEDLVKAYGDDVCILNIFPQKLSSKTSTIVAPSNQTRKKQTESKKKKVVPELGQNRVKISGPLPDDLKHLVGLEADVLSQEGSFAVLLTPAGLYPNIPLQNLTQI
jgi:hypothetical protein